MRRPKKIRHVGGGRDGTGIDREARHGGGRDEGVRGNDVVRGNSFWSRLFKRKTESGVTIPADKPKSVLKPEKQAAATSSTDDSEPIVASQSTADNSSQGYVKKSANNTSSSFDNFVEVLKSKSIQEFIAVTVITCVFSMVIAQFVISLKTMKEYYIGREAIKQCSGNIYIMESPTHRMYLQTIRDIKKTKIMTIVYTILMILYSIYCLTISKFIYPWMDSKKIDEFSGFIMVGISLLTIISMSMIPIDKPNFEKMHWIGIAFGSIISLLAAYAFLSLSYQSISPYTYTSAVYSCVAVLIPLFLTLNIIVRNRSIKIMGEYEDKITALNESISTATEYTGKTFLHNYLDDISALHNISAQDASILIDNGTIKNVVPYLKTDSQQLYKQLEVSLGKPVTQDFDNWKTYYFMPTITVVKETDINELLSRYSTNITLGKLKDTLPQFYSLIEANVTTLNNSLDSDIDVYKPKLARYIFTTLQKLRSDDVPIETYHQTLTSLQKGVTDHFNGEAGVLTFIKDINIPTENSRGLEDIKSEHDTINSIIGKVRSLLVVNTAEREILRSQKGIFFTAFICLFAGAAAFYYVLGYYGLQYVFFIGIVLLVVAVVAFLWITGAFVQS